MELLQLDVRTLAFVSSLGGLIMAVTMAGIHLAGMKERALLDWSLGGLAFGGGYLVGHLLLTLPGNTLPGWVSATLANTLIGLGHALIMLGVLRYFGYHRSMWWLFGALVLFFGGTTLIPEVQDSLRGRVIAQSAWYIVPDLVAASLLWRARSAGLTAYHRASALVLFIFGAFLTMRLGYAVLSPAFTTSFVQNAMQGAAFLISMVFGYALTVALALQMFRRTELELERLAQLDPLTQLYNRLNLDARATEEVARSRRYGDTLSLMLVDIDHFKAINDAHGHATGDSVLQRVAECIRHNLRQPDSAFRFGGEEFLVLMPHTDADGAGAAAERMRGCIAGLEPSPDQPGLSITASVGVVEVLAEGETWEEALARADTALYKAKRKGRDRVELGDGRRRGPAPEQQAGVTS